MDGGVGGEALGVERLAPLASVSLVMLRPLFSSKVAEVRSSSAVKVTSAVAVRLVVGRVEVGDDDVAGDVELRADGGCGSEGADGTAGTRGRRAARIRGGSEGRLEVGGHAF